MQVTKCSVIAQDLAKAAERMVLDPQLHLVFLVTPQQEAEELLPAKAWTEDFKHVYRSLTVLLCPALHGNRCTA